MTITWSRNKARLLGILGAVLLLVLTMAINVQASHAFLEISIPVETVVEAPEDTTTQLATADVPDEFTNHLCNVTAHSENQRSVHPGNDLLVESGTSQVVLSNVESEPGVIVDVAEQLELGEVITVSLIMGPDKVFSAGIEVIVQCPHDETTTSITDEVLPTEVTTTTTATTLAEETTTSAAVSTEVTTTDTSTSIAIEDDVEGTEVLPFTGNQTSEMGLMALALLAAGTLLVVGTLHPED